MYQTMLTSKSPRDVAIVALAGGKEGGELKRDLGDKCKVHILARDNRTGGDEAGVAAHEFHEANPTWYAPGLSVGTIDYMDGFLHRAEKAEGARDKPNIVVNGLRHADD